MAWSETTSRSWTATPYQLTLVPGHPTEYIYDGKAMPMTSQAVTVPTRGGGAIRRAVWFTRYGPVVSFYQGPPLPWTTKTAFALADADAANLRLMNQFLGIDEAGSAAQVLSVLNRAVRAGHQLPGRDPRHELHLRPGRHLGFRRPLPTGGHGGGLLRVRQPGLCPLRRPDQALLPPPVGDRVLLPRPGGRARGVGHGRVGRALTARSWRASRTASALSTLPAIREIAA